jgi:integrase
VGGRAKLTPLKVRALREPGRYGDGDGLYLQVAQGGSKQWLFRFMLDGRSREMGLGGVGAVTLAEARDLARKARAAAKAGTDPIEARNAVKRQAASARQRALGDTFRAVADAFVKAREGEWRNAKHRYQWRQSLASYGFPVIGDMPVAEVDTAAVLRVLEPIWTAMPETATRLRGRIENVLDYAKTRELRSGENPARWRGHLSHLLAKPNKRLRVQHHPALPCQHIGAFMAALRQRPATAARALELAILTAARSGEVLGTRWREVDLDAGVWVVPAQRMKAGREHRVPLSAAALDVLRAMHALSRGPDSPVFPSAQDARKPLSNMGMEMLIRRMSGGGQGELCEPPRWCDREGRAITVHGFRSSFRDWVGGHGPLGRHRRGRAGAQSHEPSRGRIPAWRPVRKAAQADGGLGGVVRRGHYGRGGRVTLVILGDAFHSLRHRLPLKP